MTRDTQRPRTRQRDVGAAILYTYLLDALIWEPYTLPFIVPLIVSRQRDDCLDGIRSQAAVLGRHVRGSEIPDMLTEHGTGEVVIGRQIMCPKLVPHEWARL